MGFKRSLVRIQSPRSLLPTSKSSFCGREKKKGRVAQKGGDMMTKKDYMLTANAITKGYKDTILHDNDELMKSIVNQLCTL